MKRALKYSMESLFASVITRFHITHAIRFQVRHHLYSLYTGKKLIISQKKCLKFVVINLIMLAIKVLFCCFVFFLIYFGCCLGFDKFKGTTIHSHSYKEPSSFDGKRVVVIGIGNSGGDISVELGKHANKVGILQKLDLLDKNASKRRRDIRTQRCNSAICANVFVLRKIMELKKRNRSIF